MRKIKQNRTALTKGKAMCDPVYSTLEGKLEEFRRGWFIKNEYEISFAFMLKIKVNT